MLRCPRDRHELVLEAENKGKKWCCNICSGRFLQSYPSRPLKTKGASFPREYWDPQVKCPRHKKTTMLSFRHRGVTLDYCVKCSSVWLDGDDVEKVLGLGKGGDPKRPGRGVTPDGSRTEGALHGFVEEALGQLIQGAIEALLSP